MQKDKRNFFFVLACAGLEICAFYKNVNRRSNKRTFVFVIANRIRERYRINVKRRLEFSTGTFDKVIPHATIVSVFFETFFIEHPEHKSRIKRFVIRCRNKHHREIAFARRIGMSIVVGADFRHSCRNNRRKFVSRENDFLHSGIFLKFRRRRH